MALLEAMVTGRNIRLVDAPALSERVRGVLPELQGVLSNWNSSLQRICIFGEATPAPDTPESVGSFFSGGIDSMHTLAENMERISHLVVSRGFDHDDDETGWQRRWSKQQHFAGEAGKNLVRVDTNARQWMESRRLTWRLGHGLYLSSVGSMLGFRTMLIPASHTYNELFPWGSHPVTDPMWSTESTHVEHYGASRRRTEKTEVVLRERLFADNLVVCWRSSSDNCGTCPKCVRTMLAIDLLGGSTALPPCGPDTPMNVFDDVDEGLITFVDDLLFLAKERGRKDIERVMARYHRKYHRQVMVHALDEAMLGGMLRKAKWALRKPEWSTWRVNRRGH